MARMRAYGTRIGGSALVLALLLLLATGAAAAPKTTSFTPPLQLGYPEGDDWESDVAADGRGNVYVAWAHYGEVPGCDTCSSPAAIIQISRDGGRSWEAPKPLNPTPVRAIDDSYQIDLQVAVNAAGAVFVAYLDGKETVLQRSDDFGRSFSLPVIVNAGVKRSWTDKVGLAVQGEDVYVSYSIAQRFFVASSHDGGRTFSSVQLPDRSKDYGWTLTSGGVVDSKGAVYFSWVGVHQSGNALGPQDLFLTKSTDKGKTWSFLVIEKGVPPGPPCGEFYCGWDFWGPQIVVSVNERDHVFVAYNAGTEDQGPPAVWFRSSTDGGKSWSARTPIHTDWPSNAYHLYPAIEGGAGDAVYVAWMDNRMGGFNVWSRASQDGGKSWSKEVQVSAYVPGYDYKTEDGFAFTYGDYFGIAWDGRATVHLAWAEGPDYIGPGTVWYAHS